ADSLEPDLHGQNHLLGVGQPESFCRRSSAPGTSGYSYSPSLQGRESLPVSTRRVVSSPSHRRYDHSLGSALAPLLRGLARDRRVARRGRTPDARAEERTGIAGMKLFRILSIDGGGVKGVFPAAFLAALEQSVGFRALDHVDLIVGTSTGGILALGLG